MERAELAKNLEAFFHEWCAVEAQKSSALESRLQLFISEWQDVGGTQAQYPTEKGHELDFEALRAGFEELSPIGDVLQSMRRSGKFANVWEVSGISCDELRVSSVLAWFLSHHGGHGLGGVLLARLLAAIDEKPLDFPTAESVLKKPYWINLESCPSGDRCSRVDIEIENERFLLFIEVKIYAPENNNQLDRYLEIARSKAGIRPYGVIFLTPTGRMPISSPKARADVHVIPMKWKKVAEVFARHASQGEPGYIQPLLAQFASHISTF